MTQDIIIVGAGPAGLFAAASTGSKTNSLILNNGPEPGRKLLIAGAGKCNFTNGGSIKDFISRYGKQGPRIRKALYGFSNAALVRYLENNGIETWTREDGKIFPKSLRGSGILELLLKDAARNGFSLKNKEEVREIGYDPEVGVYTIATDTGEKYPTKKLVLATGGLSYPGTGSNGSILESLRELGIALIPGKPALVPIYVDSYPYSSLAGISFKNILVTVGEHKKRGDLLLTHKNFSGPAILDLSRYSENGQPLVLNYLGDTRKEDLAERLAGLREGSGRQALTAVLQAVGGFSPDIPRRFVELICSRAGIEGGMKMAELSNSRIRTLAELFTGDRFRISGNSGFQVAMCTAGGVSLDEVDLSTFEAKAYPGLYIIGELLDVDGDTGGFNVQFAFSSGYACATNIGRKLV